jgi:hypothetical protein
MCLFVPLAALQKAGYKRHSHFLPEIAMRAKLTPDKQIALPESVLDRVGSAEHFEITVEDGRIILTPIPAQKPDSADRTPDAIRQKLEQLGITEQDIEDAVTWARR